MELIFDKPKAITVVPSQVVTTNKITINHVTDDGEKVTALITPFEDGISRRCYITIWDGDAYKNIGQWTDTDVVNRLKELL